MKMREKIGNKWFLIIVTLVVALGLVVAGCLPSSKAPAPTTQTTTQG